MFLQDNSGGPDSLKGAFQNAAQAYTQLQSAILEFDKAAKSVSADVFGQGAAAAAEMRKEIAEATSNMAGLGVSASDVASTMASIGTIMQRNVYLTNQQLESFIAIQKATNLTGEDMATLVEGFDAIGVGPTQAAEQIESARKRAASLGLNTGQFLKTVGDNVKLINSYNFRNGVEGFTNMVARSQALRINMADVTSLAGKLLDPSEAINLASEFQMLGGAVGALADPFQLMNMAQNDIDGLQESIVNAASAAVSFNSETGSFAISATEMRRLRAQASALGMDYEELANTAVKSAQRQEALSQLDLLGGAYTDEDKEFLANIGQFDGGELKFNLPGQDELKSATELTTKEIETLKETFRKNNLDSDEIAREQLTVLEQIEATLIDPAKRVVAGIAATDQFEELEKRLKDTSTTISETIGKSLTPENVQKAFEVTDEVFKDAAEIFSDSFSAYSERGVQGLGTSLAESFNERLTNLNLSNVSLPNYNLPRVGLPTLPGGNNTGGSGNNSGQGAVPSAIIPVNVAKVTNTDPMKVEVVRGTFDDLNVNHTGTIQLQGGGMSLQSLQTDPTALSNLTQMIQQEMARQGTSY
ncbi:hypothetical protein N9H63_01700 [bacterium]|nr:hypothetical protein [bacterium]